MSKYARYGQITHELHSLRRNYMHAMLINADNMRNTLILSVTKFIAYSANHKPGTSAY